MNTIEILNKYLHFRNAVGFLQEYCMKNKLDPPIYQETPKDDFGEFGFSCTFENFSAIGRFLDN